MMSGIDADGLTNLATLVEEEYLDLEKQYSSLTSSFEVLDDCIEGVDLKFLTADFNDEIAQLENLNTKCEGYYITMQEVVNGYISQEQNIASSVSLYLK